MVLLAPLLLVALGRVELAVETSSILGRLARGMLRLLRRAHHTRSDDEHDDGGDAEDEPRELTAILRRPARNQHDAAERHNPSGFLTTALQSLGSTDM